MFNESYYIFRKDVKLSMGYTTQYTGPQIDEALEKGRGLRVVNNGWIRLNSSTSSPTNLGDLKNPGNYVTSFWIDGPTTESTYTPINLVIVTIGEDIYQFAELGAERYSRVMTSGASLYGSWSINQSEGATNPSPTEPANPVDGKTLWLDTSDANTPVLKLYLNGEWVEVVPEAAMLASVYDPTGKKTDIFKYIDDAVADVSTSSSGINFDEHINDTSIHVTSAEKVSWNNKATEEDLNAAVAGLKAELDSEITSGTSEFGTATTQLLETVNALSTEIEEHVNNTNIHPDSAKIAEWDAKAGPDHTHYLDGNVTVDVDHVEGTIPSELLPYDVKERAYVVGSLDEMYALPKNPYHNGDAICVETESGSSWYYIVNDEYLGTENASQAFKQFSAGATGLSWSSISNTPTTIEGYGITDAATAETFNALQEEIDEIKTTIPTEDIQDVAECQTVYNAAVSNLNNMSGVFDGLEPVISTLETIIT